MMIKGAWVTLATNDSYALGALVLAHSLRQVNTQYPCVVLITPSITDSMRERLHTVYAEVVSVDVLDSRDSAHLALLQRPELGITFTKLHCWNLLQYEKCVFLDADTLVMQNCDELFEREELSAAPDVGWPDCFNSGVFVFKPSKDTFDKLVRFANDHGSFDGGDQGLLNSFFSNWAQGDMSKRLPFIYNVTSAAFYSYLPALQHYGRDAKIVHFIGSDKPWLQPFNWSSGEVNAPGHLQNMLQLWWNLFVTNVHSQLNPNMSGVAGNFAKIVSGSTRTIQTDALNELTRRQGWETGNIDYMGADSFDNIWAKISDTLNKPRESPSKTLEKITETNKNQNDDKVISNSEQTKSEYCENFEDFPSIKSSDDSSIKQLEPVSSGSDGEKIETFKDNSLLLRQPTISADSQKNVLLSEHISEQTPLVENFKQNIEESVQGREKTEKQNIELTRTLESPPQTLISKLELKEKVEDDVDLKQKDDKTHTEVAKEAPKIREASQVTSVQSSSKSESITANTETPAKESASKIGEDQVINTQNTESSLANTSIDTKLETTQEKTENISNLSSDSPPLANTPTKNDDTIVSEAKSLGEAEQETLL